MPSRRTIIENPAGPKLAAIIDSPTAKTSDARPITAVFAHCFTCTKDLKAIVKISRRLVNHGIAVVRFDFRGLGGSAGEFSNSNFLTNIEDLELACQWTAENLSPPELLIGHSLGGAAAMATVMQLPWVKALATLAAPSCTVHLAEFLANANPGIDVQGQGEVVIGGTAHTITKPMLDSMRQFDLRRSIEAITKPHLVLHAPTDTTVKYEHAQRIMQWGNSAAIRSLITLEGSDHLLLKRRQDVDDVADLISTWARHIINR